MLNLVTNLDSYKNRKILAISLFICSFAHFAFHILYLSISGGHAWGFGEWLINYSGGYVRRGLFGEIFLLIFGGLANPLIALAILQIMVYSFLWLFAFNVMKNLNFSWFSLALVCNPAGVLFSGWDIYVLARKESLGLASLILLGFSLRNENTKATKLFVFGILLYIFSLFASEVNLFLIAGVYYFIKRKYPKKSSINLIFLSTLLLAVFIYLTVNYHGNSNIAQKVCSEITGSGINIKNCDGAIATLEISLSQAVEHLKGDYPANLIYYILLIIGLIPLISTKWILSNKKFLVFVFASYAPLYLLAWDYGRWNYMIIFQTTIIYVFSEKFDRMQLLKIDPTWYKWNLYTAFPFILFWGVWHGGNPVNNGLIGPVFTTFRTVYWFLMSL